MNESGTADPGGLSDPVSRASRHFEPAAATPAAVRAFARSTLDGWDLVPDETVLVAHELATNAIFHAAPAPAFTVALLRRDARVRVEVSAATPDGEPPGPGGDGSERGLVLVRGLASTWGVLVHGGGTTLWAEIDVHRRAGAPSSTGHDRRSEDASRSSR